MKSLSEIRPEKVSKKRCEELVKRPDSRQLLNSLIYARVILESESELNLRDIYYNKFLDERDSLLGCLIVLRISRDREDLAQRLEEKFSQVPDFGELQKEDYQDIVDMFSEVSYYISDSQEEE